MRMMVLFLLIVLVGCIARPSLEQLEDEAMVSGDWSAVEKREQSSIRLNPVNDRSCPNGRAMVCVKNGMHEECECVNSRSIP